MQHQRETGSDEKHNVALRSMEKSLVPEQPHRSFSLRRFDVLLSVWIRASRPPGARQPQRAYDRHRAVIAIAL